MASALLFTILSGLLWWHHLAWSSWDGKEMVLTMAMSLGALVLWLVALNQERPMPPKDENNITKQ